jgi:hypothetical protein
MHKEWELRSVLYVAHTWMPSDPIFGAVGVKWRYNPTSVPHRSGWGLINLSGPSYTEHSATWCGQPIFDNKLTLLRHASRDELSCPCYIMSYDVMSSFWHSINICLLFITFICKPEVRGIFQSNYREVPAQGLTAWCLTATHSPRAECAAVSICRWEARYVTRHTRDYVLVRIERWQVGISLCRADFMKLQVDICNHLDKCSDNLGN